MSLAPGPRRFVLTAHIASSVGWLGAVAAFLALAVVGLTGDDVELLRGAYLAMEPITRFALVPLALASLGTGIVQSLGTHWGLFRHYWVLVKFVLAIVAALVLLRYTQTIGHLAATAADGTTPAGELRALAASPVVHAAGGLAVLLTTTVLSVYKPRGMTRYGRRRRRRGARSDRAT